MVDQTVATFGRLDMAFNNAGSSRNATEHARNGWLLVVGWVVGDYAVLPMRTRSRSTQEKGCSPGLTAGRS
jgi:NAD(P)-dependent dehydrogenase (short-subunit alcohol dehydrogenase family)